MPGSTPSKKMLETVVTTDCPVVRGGSRGHRRSWRGNAHDVADRDRDRAGGPRDGSAMDHTTCGAGNPNLTSYQCERSSSAQTRSSLRSSSAWWEANPTAAWPC